MLICWLGLPHGSQGFCKKHMTAQSFLLQWPQLEGCQDDIAFWVWTADASNPEDARMCLVCKPRARSKSKSMQGLVDTP